MCACVMAGAGEDEEAQGLVQAFPPEQPRVGHSLLHRRKQVGGPQGLISASFTLTRKKYVFIVVYPDLAQARAK